MKLTKDMFDFEKYDYYTKWAPSSCYLSDVKSMLWQPPRDGLPDGLYRVNKPPPRYILLNEGEKLQAGDEVFFNSTKDWCLYSTITREVLPGEVWRRKDTTK